MNTSKDKKMLEAVINGARSILEKKNFEESARAIFDYCKDLIGAPSGYVALLSEDGQENEVLFLEAGGLPCTVDPELPMPIRGLRAIAYESHKAVYENDFMNSEWAGYMPAGHVEMRNVMFSPLNIEDQTVGIMGLANKPSDFTVEDSEIATVFGELAAVALQNSRHIELLNDKTISLEKALADIKTLRGFLPICSHCKKIRDDQGYWNQIESYISEHSMADFSHSICPECERKYYLELEKNHKQRGDEDVRNK
jgi:transcriptional regulator with GAF, ATPase, and Fis domain